MLLNRREFTGLGVALSSFMAPLGASAIEYQAAKAEQELNEARIGERIETSWQLGSKHLAANQRESEQKDGKMGKIVA